MNALQGPVSDGTFCLALIRLGRVPFPAPRVSALTLARSLCAFGTAALATASLLSPALAEDVNATAKYVVTLGGLNVANINVDLTDDGQKYALDLTASVAGLANLVASGSASIISSGRATSPALTAQQFNLATHAKGEDFTVDVSYAGHDVTAFKVDPPLVDNYNRVPIERSHLTNVGDMLSSFVFKGGTLDKSLCQRKMQIFTGVERFNIALRYTGDDEATSLRTGYQGPVILCNIKYTPVSGHFTTSDMTNYLAKSDRILIWYAPLGTTGYFIPYRLLLTTSVGDLSMVLTDMKS